MARHATDFLSDFREFIQRGNVVDLAVAVVIGTAFSKIVDSFVSDVITPAILTPALQAANVDDLSQLTAGTIRYGSFLAAILNFLVIALSIFVLIRMLEAAKRRVLRQQDEVVEEAVEPLLLSQERLTTAVERLSQVIESR
ncbi:MAG: large conductance mechanosensitive channel protein MscL [Timaviella obliquedivisa GSE-PSE-MK23-08B]|jgi:large conductance mechanosensitive channel|nr:large conductance mechanosensitive channel protein MscL [Timaviella obliquedivisa GSE-PSE-MK23-08B]